MVFGIGYNPENDARIIISAFNDIKKNFHNKFKTRKYFIGSDFVKYFKKDYVHEESTSHKVSPTKRLTKTADKSFHYDANKDLIFHTMQFGKTFSFRCFYYDVEGFEAVMTFEGAKISYRTTSFHPNYVDGTGTMSSRKATKLSSALIQIDRRFIDASTRWD